MSGVANVFKSVIYILYGFAHVINISFYTRIWRFICCQGEESYKEFVRLEDDSQMHTHPHTLDTIIDL